MKKYILIVVTLLLVSTLTFVIIQKMNKVDHVNTEAKYKSYASFDELDNDSKIVIRGKKISEEYIVFDRFEDGTPIGKTLTTFKIDKVFRNTDSDPEVEPGNTIKILESSYFDKERNIFYHTEGYLNMTVNQKYLLMLEKSSTDPWYLIKGLHQGKIPLDTASSEMVDSNNKVKPLDAKEKDFYDKAREKLKE